MQFYCRFYISQNQFCHKTFHTHVCSMQIRLLDLLLTLLTSNFQHSYHTISIFGNIIWCLVHVCFEVRYPRSHHHFKFSMYVEGSCRYWFILFVNFYLICYRDTAFSNFPNHFTPMILHWLKLAEVDFVSNHCFYSHALCCVKCIYSSFIHITNSNNLQLEPLQMFLPVNCINHYVVVKSVNQEKKIIYIHAACAKSSK